MTTEERQADDIERDIDHTRARIDRNVDELGDRLSPGGLVDEATSYLKDGGQAIASGLSTAGSSIGRTVRENPVPALLVCAGLAWFAVSAARGRTSDTRNGDPVGAHRVGNYRDNYGRGYPTEGGDADARRPMGTARGAVMGDEMAQDNGDHDGGSGIKAKAADVRDKAKDGASRVAERSRDAAGAVADRLGSAREKAAEYGSHARDRAVKTYDDQPLMVGVLGLAVGAAIGLALPATRREDRVMGPYRDDLKDRARDFGREQVDRAERVADAAVTAARDEMGDTSPASDGSATSERVTDKIGKAAKAAANAATKEAKKGSSDQPKEP